MSGRERGRGRRRLAVVWLVPLVAVAAGCALPTQGSPSAISASRVPFNLLDPHPPTTTTQPRPTSYVSAKVYFLNANANDALAPADRLVSAPAGLSAIIGALVDGPSSGEAAQGLTTAIPSDVAVLSAMDNTASNIVTVNFNTAFGQITGTATEQAVAQVVATVVNEIGLGTGVVFEINGTHTSVPIANGSQVARPVYLFDVVP